MKKVCMILFVMVFVGIMPYHFATAETLQPTDAFYVNDFADVIDENVEEEIIEYGNRLEEETGAQVVLVTVDFTDGEALENYALELFNGWGIGSEEKNNGILILLSIGDGDYWAMQGEGLEDTLSSGKISSLLQEYLEPDFAAKDYSAGAEKIYGAFIKELGGQWEDAAEPTGVSSQTADQYTFDNADIINDDTQEYINQKSTEFKKIYNAGFYVVTKDSRGEGLDFQDDAINTFEELHAGSRDALLVLYKEDDNYWLLPGETTEKFATENVLRNILDDILEPDFAAKDYSAGAKNTADQFYTMFQGNYTEVTPEEKDEGPTITPEKINQIMPLIVVAVFLIFVYILLKKRSRMKNYREYGVPYNPHRPRNINIYMPRRHWRDNGPYMGGGGFSGGRNSYSDDNDDNGAGRSSGGSFWGSGGGAGRSSSHGSSSSGESRSSSGGSFSGGGGVSRGGGAGRSSGGSAGPSSSGHASGGGRASSGGGGSSRGGGAGRR